MNFSACFTRSVARRWYLPPVSRTAVSKVERVKVAARSRLRTPRKEEERRGTGTPCSLAMASSSCASFILVRSFMISITSRTLLLLRRPSWALETTSRRHWSPSSSGSTATSTSPGPTAPAMGVASVYSSEASGTGGSESAVPPSSAMVAVRPAARCRSRRSRARARTLTKRTGCGVGKPPGNGKRGSGRSERAVCSSPAPRL